MNDAPTRREKPSQATSSIYGEIEAARAVLLLAINEGSGALAGNAKEGALIILHSAAAKVAALADLLGAMESSEKEP